jgi:hypothetical protein
MSNTLLARTLKKIIKNSLFHLIIDLIMDQKIHFYVDSLKGLRVGLSVLFCFVYEKKMKKSNGTFYSRLECANPNPNIMFFWTTSCSKKLKHLK